MMDREPFPCWVCGQEVVDRWIESIRKWIPAERLSETTLRWHRCGQQPSLSLGESESLVPYAGRSLGE